MNSELPRRRILISRTDAIGDVVLTLPLAAIIRTWYPAAHIGFLCSSYTKAVVMCCTEIDEIVIEADFLAAEEHELRKAWDTIIHVFPRRSVANKAKRAGIRLRIGTRNRLYHWVTCNKLVRLSRRASSLHEAQLNTILLQALGIDCIWSLEKLGRMYSFNRIPILSEELGNLINNDKYKIILHPASHGSAREWSIEKYHKLIALLNNNPTNQVIITGTAKDAEKLEPLLNANANALTSLVGKLTLDELIAVIAKSDALIAASTGPLHIAAALNKKTIGIYPRIRPMHAGRWSPLGPLAQSISLNGFCKICRDEPKLCNCMNSVTVAQVFAMI